MSDTFYIPKKGDIIMMWFGPTSNSQSSPVGHEQYGKRPAVVVSDDTYNSKTKLFRACPITKHAKGYPFEVPVEQFTKRTYGVVLCDQVGCFSVERVGSFVEVAPVELLEIIRKNILELFA